MKHKIETIIVSGAVMLLLINSNRAATLSSTFDTDLDGWTTGSLPPAKLSFDPVGGNPGGGVIIVGGSLSAPAKFLGDLSGFDGGKVSFDAIFLGGGGGLISAEFGTIYISSAADSAHATIDHLEEFTDPNQWKRHAASFTATTFGVTQGRWLALLTNVHSIWVNTFAEYETRLGFDNFTISTAPAPGTNACPAPSFAAPHAISGVDGSSPVAVGDFNGDGKLDVVTSSSVLLGNGDGTFQMGWSVSDWGVGLGEYPEFFAVGDFNGDGKADLAVANWTGVSVTVLVSGAGPLNFKAATGYSYPGLQYQYDIGGLIGAAFPGESHRVVAADFNGDGKLDLAAVDWNIGGDLQHSNSVWLLLGNGDGTFQSPVNAGAGGGSLAVGDFNGDGKPDLVVGAGFRVMLGNGDGTFRTVVGFNASGIPFSVGDINGDGREDLVMANFHTDADPYGSVRVLLGNGDGTFRLGASYLGPGTSVAVGDFNGDGKPDLAVENGSGSPRVSVLVGNGDGTFQAAVNYDVKTSARSIAVGDFNGDGRPDLVLGTVKYDYLYVLLNTCASTSTELAIAPGNGHTLTISWPFPSAGFVLESAASLSPLNWQPVTDVPKTNATRLELSAPLDSPQRFFRLHKN